MIAMEHYYMMITNFPDYTINTVKEVYENGSYLIPVTARTLNNLKTIAKQLKIDQLRNYCR
nr:hypothetical protein [Entomoplasma sp. MP1]